MSHNPSKEQGSRISSARTTRRSLLRGTTAAAALTGLAGCSGIFAGSGDSDSGALKIGVLGPLDRQVGEDIRNGANIAVDELNSEDGIDGMEIEVLARNTELDPATAQDRYVDLVVGEEVDAVIGVWLSENVINLMDSFAEHETINIVTGGTTPRPNELVRNEYDRYKYFFRNVLNTPLIGQNMIEFIEENADQNGWERVAVLAEDFAWTEPISAELEGDLADTGVTVTMNRRYASDTDDFSPLYDEVEETDSDIALIAMAITGNPALNQWANQQRSFGFVGHHAAMQSSTYWDESNGQTLFGTTRAIASQKAPITDKTVPYAEKYHEEHGRFPIYTGYSTYDAVYELATAIEDAGTTDSDELVNALENISYTGTIGTIEHYGPDHEHAHDLKYGRDLVPSVWTQWQEVDGEGSQEVIWPDGYATGEYQSPSWIS